MIPALFNSYASWQGAYLSVPWGSWNSYTPHVRRPITTSAKLRFASFDLAPAPPDIFERALKLQRDLATTTACGIGFPIPDLLIAETALHHGLGVVHADADYDRTSEVRPLVARRLR